MLFCHFERWWCKVSLKWPELSFTLMSRAAGTSTSSWWRGTTWEPSWPRTELTEAGLLPTTHMRYAWHESPGRELLLSQSWQDFSLSPVQRWTQSSKRVHSPLLLSNTYRWRGLWELRPPGPQSSTRFSTPWWTTGWVSTGVTSCFWQISCPTRCDLWKYGRSCLRTLAALTSDFSHL